VGCPVEEILAIICVVVPAQAMTLVAADLAIPSNNLVKLELDSD
jgi:hypothetical protein